MAEDREEESKSSISLDLGLQAIITNASNSLGPAIEAEAEAAAQQQMAASQPSIQAPPPPAVDQSTAAAQPATRA